jgi:hypothetical protein
MSRLRANCSVMLVPPCVLVEFIESRPAMVANCFSRGSATADAMVSGLAPGRPACTWMVGKSTVGKSATGSSRYDITPNTVMPSMISVVVIGRRMNSAAKFMTSAWRRSRRGR